MIIRRRVLAALAFAAATPARGIAAQTSGEILIAQTAALTGLQAEVGIAFTAGARAAFDSANAAGGINGRTLNLVSVDDGYQASRTRENLDRFLADGKPWAAFFGCTGTACTAAAVDVLKGKDLALVAPLTGAAAIQAAAPPNVFFVRGTYADEVEKILQHLEIIGIKRIAVFFQNDGFGKSVMTGLPALVQRCGLQLVAEMGYDPKIPELGFAPVAQLARPQPQAVLHISTARFSAELLKHYEKTGVRSTHYGLSVVSTAELLRVAEDRATGFVIAQRFPAPRGGSRLAQAFQSSLGPDTPATLRQSYSAMEGYVSATVLLHALRRAGSPEPVAVQRALAAIRDHDFGSLTLDYGAGRRGSRFTDMVMVKAGGGHTR